MIVFKASLYLLLSLTFLVAHAQSSRSKNIKTYGQSQQPSRSIASEPSSSASSSLGSQHFICTDGNSSFPCDSSGNPVGSNSFISGGKTRSQLVDDCYNKSANSDLSSTESQLRAYCSGWVDQNQRPNNAVDIPKSESADPGDFADAAAQERAQKLSECMEGEKSADECTKMLDNNNSASAITSDCKNHDGVQCLDDKTETPAQSKAVNQAALCDQAHSTAMSDCDTERQSWMKNIQMAAQGLGPIMESGACGKLSAANVGASTSLATFKVMCNSAAQACETACAGKMSLIVDENEKFSSNLKACRAKGTKAAEAEQAAAQGTQQLLAAVATCKNTFGVNANPFNINNDPYKGQTAEEIMAGLQPAQGGPMEYSGTSGSAAGTGNSNFDLSGLEQDDEPRKPRAAAKAAAGAPGGSMGSAGMGGGGGSSVDGGGGGGTGGKRPSGGLLSNILSGFFGGGGGGSNLFGGTGRSKSGGLSSFFGGEKPQETKTPDLRQFMPGGKMDPRKARGLAGQRLNADGMSGPHGNIWRMINNRYQYKKASLLP